jgi:KDO2-lipid IV(A) lauroyltransferase
LSALRQAWKTVKRNAGYGLAVTLRSAVAAVPASARLSLGERLGALAWNLARRDRRRAIEHLGRAFASEGRSDAEVRRIGRESFRNLGRCFAELCGLSRAGAGPREVLALVDTEDGAGRFRRLLAGGRGLVVVTAHLDNWELAGAATACAGLPVVAVARRLYFEKYDQLVNGLRRRFGMEIVYQDESPRKLLRALRDGKLVALLADQDVPRLDGVFVPFFGRPAYTPSGPAALAATAGVELVLAHTLREGRGRHRLLVSEPIQFDRSEKDRAVLEGTRAWCALLEGIIRQHPEQWVWMHRRWRTVPAQRPEAARRSGLAVDVIGAPVLAANGKWQFPDGGGN